VREEVECADGVPLYAGAMHVRDTEARASFRDATDARLVEERRGVAVIAKNVLSFLEPDREVVARRDVSGIAGVAQAFRFGIARMAGGECQASRDHDDERNPFDQKRGSER
jgi:hypothetical protein